MRKRSLNGYLVAIYDREMSGGGATVSGVAKQLGVATPSASEMIGRMVERRLVEHQRYGWVYLTEEGRDLAEEVCRKHRVLKRFFTEILRVDRKTADMEAREIRGVISGEIADRIDRLTGEMRGDDGKGMPDESKPGDGRRTPRPDTGK